MGYHEQLQLVSEASTACPNTFTFDHAEQQPSPSQVDPDKPGFNASCCGCLTAPFNYFPSRL